MKKSLAILILSVYVVSTTELIQLLKLPVLVEHYLEHRERDSHISFSDFIGMHYTSEDSHDADYDQDMKLPFKSHHCCTVFSSGAFIAVTESFDLTIHIQPGSLVHHPLPSINLPSGIQSGIWQPPKQLS